MFKANSITLLRLLLQIFVLALDVHLDELLFKQFGSSPPIGIENIFTRKNRFANVLVNIACDLGRVESSDDIGAFSYLSQLLISDVWRVLTPRLVPI